MKRSLFLLILISPIFLFCTCHKQKETILDFTFIDSQSKQPIQDIEIYLQEFDQGGVNGLISNMKTIASYKTNAMGNLYTKLKYLNPEKKYGIEWQKPSECYETSNGPYPIAIGQENKFERPLNTLSFYSIHIKNVNPYDANDKICYSSDKFATFSNFCQIGNNIDFSFKYSSIGNKYWYNKSFITKNNVTILRIDSIFLKPCDTNEINVFY